MKVREALDVVTFLTGLLNSCLRMIIAPVGHSIDYSGARVGVGAWVAHCEFSVPLPLDQSKLSVRPCKIRLKSGSAPMVLII